MTVLHQKLLKTPYPLHQSPLFKIKGKAQFESIIGLDWYSCKSLSDNIEYYYHHGIVIVADKDRKYQKPIYDLETFHRKIASYLRKIKQPDYVFSKKGRSFIDNAAEHVSLNPLIKTDIKSFFPSVSREMIFNLFSKKFQCSNDIASLLADLCTVPLRDDLGALKQVLPTGSFLSDRLAFWAYVDVFDQINLLAQTHRCVFTLYVDDITISGEKATKKMLSEVRQLLRNNGLKTKNSKSITYASKQSKTVTGVRLSNSRMLASNKLQKKIRITKKQIDCSIDLVEIVSLKGSLKGQQNIIKQIYNKNREF